MTPSESGSQDRNEKSSGLPITGWLAVGALLGFIGCLVLGYTATDPWKQAATNVGVPVFTLAFGTFAADAYYRKEGDKKVQEKVRLAAYTTLGSQYALERAHEPIRAAVDGAYELGSMEQVGELRAAEMALHSAYVASYQTLHELDALAVDNSVIAAAKERFEANSEAIGAQRPTVRLGDKPRTKTEDSGVADTDPTRAPGQGEG